MDLFELRIRNRKTQWDLRIATGIHQSKLSLIERGYVEPSIKEKHLIAAALDMSVDKIDWPEQRC